MDTTPALLYILTVSIGFFRISTQVADLTKTRHQKEVHQSALFLYLCYTNKSLSSLGFRVELSTFELERNSQYQSSSIF